MLECLVGEMSGKGDGMVQGTILVHGAEDWCTGRKEEFHNDLQLRVQQAHSGRRCTLHRCCRLVAAAAAAQQA